MVVATIANAAVIAGALAGCDRVLGLHATALSDAHQPVPDCQPGDDKDGDGIDDCYDNCPGIANPMQEDVLEVRNGQPADGIGDACDPAPTTTGDVRTRFISFTEPDEQAEWQVIAGSWVIGNGAYTYTPDNSSSVERTSFRSARPAAPFAIQLGVDPIAIPSTTIETFGLTLDSGVGQACEIYTGNQDELNVYAPNVLAVSVAAGSFVEGGAFTLRGSVRGTTVACSIDNVVAGTQTATTTPPPPPSGKLGLYAKTGGFAVTYVDVYDLSGEPP